jgi:hypothetical protein
VALDLLHQRAIGIVALFTVAAVLHIPVKRRTAQDRLGGTASVGSGVTAIILLTTWEGLQYAWGSPVIIGLGRLVAAARLLHRRDKGLEPIIPLDLFKNRTFSAASGVGFIIGFSMFGAIIYLPLYLQTVHGASPTAVGTRAATRWWPAC